MFDGFTILHISDMHIDMNAAPMQRLVELLPHINYDLCVLTGDYRGKTFGPYDAALDGLAQVRRCLKPPVYGCWATTTRSAWFRDWKRWAFACYSTNLR